MTRALLLALAIVALPAVASAQIEAGDTSARDAFYDDPGPDTCHAARERPIHAGFYPPLGALGRDLSVEASFGANGDVLGGTLVARGAFVRFNRYLSLLTGLSTALVHRASLDTTLGSTPVIELGLVARSECDRWHVLGSLSYAPPSTTPGSPNDWQTTIPMMLVDPWNGLLYLPRADAGGALATFDARVRTSGEDWFLAFGFRFRAGTTQVGSQYGVLRGFVGALGLEIGVGWRRAGQIPLNLMLAARLDVDLSGFWPANAVGPFAVTFPLRWAPSRFVAVEVWGGFALFLVGTAPNLPQLGGTYGLRLTTFFDL